MLIEVCIQIYTRDRELRAWLADELALMSPTIDVQAIDVLDARAAQLLIVAVEMLSPADIDRLRALTIPIIAIGSVPRQLAAVPFASVLDTGLTSKQLKRAVRDSLALPLPAQPSLQPA